MLLCVRTLRGRRGFTQQPENSKSAHLRPWRFKTPPKFHEKTPRETQKRAKRRQEGEEKARNFGPPTFGAPPFRGPTLSDPTSGQVWPKSVTFFWPKSVWPKSVSAPLLPQTDQQGHQCITLLAAVSLLECVGFASFVIGGKRTAANGISACVFGQKSVWLSV